MTNIFDVRTFNVDEQSAIKRVVDDAEEVLVQISDLNTHMNESIKDLCSRLNEGIRDKDLKIKPSLLVKMAKAKFKDKKDIEKSKTELNEVETGLSVIYKL